MNKLLQTVRIYDPAILHFNPTSAPTGVRISEWARDREMDALVLRPGMAARVYHFERLTRTQMLWVERADHEVTARDRAFALGVRRIDDENGRLWEPAGIGRPDYFGIGEAELDKLEHADIQEIGGVVLARSRVPFGCRVIYPVPHSSVAVLEGVLSLFAAPSPRAAAPSKSEPEARSEE